MVQRFAVASNLSLFSRTTGFQPVPWHRLSAYVLMYS
jgi:hypothetical protein